VWSSRNIIDCFWPWGISSPPRAAVPATLPRGKASLKMNECGNFSTANCQFFHRNLWRWEHFLLSFIFYVLCYPNVLQFESFLFTKPVTTKNTTRSRVRTCVQKNFTWKIIKCFEQQKILCCRNAPWYNIMINIIYLKDILHNPWGNL